ncbi:MAG: hydrogenobyrinic acid a,c-diamide synthase (glutamine-hydrolyzing) [Gammaproteobacteria bacterium]|nr:hydrogenobyrinic acid a,c-diamide synthase (glutamine-hydrolyzing) [Gammaproteobacteria bacterium]
MSRVFISAARKSSGKTSITIGLCAALQARGLDVQPYKKGPDYIDPHWLAKAAGRACYNLDFYTMDHGEITELYSTRSANADISIIEGNKGLYDGLDLDGSNSNAAMAKLLDTPVVLVLDARGMTRGVAPLILGYQAFDNDINIRGVILNKLGGYRHEDKLRKVIEHYTDVQVIGAVHHNPELDIEERHLGLVPSHEDTSCQRKIDVLRNAIEDQVDLNALLAIADSQVRENLTTCPDRNPAGQADITIGIVENAAFGFYYPDDLEAFTAAGARLIPIDNIADHELPQLDGLFIGGGFPETHMHALEGNKEFRRQLARAIDNGLPVYAECGGLMYLARSIKWKNEKHEMVGAIPADIIMEATPQGRGYVRLHETGVGLWPSPSSQAIAAHEFHYSRFINMPKDARFAFEVLRGTGIDGKHDGYIREKMLACYTHQRNTKNNPWVTRFVQFVRESNSQ